MKKANNQFKAVWLILIVFMCSCGTLNKIVHKKKQQEETKTETKTSETTKTETGTEITRTITEVTHTTIEIPSSNVTDSLDLAKLLNGDNIEQENDDIKFVVHVDPVSKKVTASATMKKKVIQATGEKKTVEAITQNKKEEKVLDQNQKIEKKTINTSKDKEVKIDTTIPWYFWVILFLFIILICWLALKYWFKII